MFIKNQKVKLIDGYKSKANLRHYVPWYVEIDAKIRFIVLELVYDHYFCQRKQ